MEFKEFMDVVSRALEILGVGVIIIGFVIGFGRAARDWLRGQASGVYAMIRKYFGQSILLGLEILVAADLIRTVAVEPTMENVLVLGVIVLIRTFLSFSLEVEIYGRLPWRGSKTASGGDTGSI
jgi:uncharacterized membrane protein